MERRGRVQQARRWRAVGVWLVALALSGVWGCDGLACSGPGFEVAADERLMPSQVIDPALQVTVTAEGGDFIAANGLSLAKTLLGFDGADGWVDVSGFVNDYLQRNPISFFNVTARDLVMAVKLPDPQGLRVTFLDSPPRVRVELDQLWVRVEATVVDGNTRSACRIRGDVDNANPAQRRMFTLEGLALDLALGTTATGGFKVDVDLLSSRIRDSGIRYVTESSDPWYYCNFPECSDGLPPQCGECYLVCGAGDFALSVSNFFVEWFDQVIAELVVIFVNAVLDQVEVVSGRLHPALLAGAALPELYDAQALRFGARPARSVGSFWVVPGEGGGPGDLSARLALGLAQDAVHPCVAPLGEGPSMKPPSDPGALGVGPGVGGAGRPEVALATSAALVNQALWAFYGAGALCLEADTDLVARLTQGQLDLTVDTLSLLLPGLERLAEPGSPLLLSLRPHLTAASFPLVRFGSGAATGAGDSLLEVALPDTSIGIYGRVDGHFVRLLEVEARLQLGVTPVVMPDGALHLGVDHVEVEDLIVKDDRLFQSVEAERLLSYVTALLTNVLLVQDFSLPLPLDTLAQQVFGVPLSLRVASIVRAGEAGDWLSLEVGLEVAAGGIGQAQRMAQTEAAAAPQQALPMASGEPLVVSLADAGAPLEAQYRVDGLAWSGFQPGPDLTLRSPLLSLPGPHTVEVRARYQGDPRSLDLSPLALPVLTTQAAPAAQTQPLASAPPAQGADAPTGCRAAPARGPASGGGAALAVACALGLWAARRRRAAATAAASAAAVAFLSACGDDAGEQRVACATEGDCVVGQRCGCDGYCAYPERCASSAECCGGRACVDGLCDARVECRADTDCAAQMRCVGCQCAYTTPRPDAVPCDGRCAEVEVCVAARDLCVERAGICPDAAPCAPGEVRVLTGEGAYVGEQCSYEGLGCACQQAPALPDPTPGGRLAITLEAPGRYHAAAYDRAFGDLLWLTADDTPSLGAPTALDGVPAGARPAADPSGPRGGVTDPGPDVGRYPSAAFTSAGALAISSYDATDGALRLAIRPSVTAEWRVFTVDDAADAGRYTSMAALSDGRLVIAYQARDLNAAGQGVTALRLAVARTTKPQGPEDFLIRDVDVAPAHPDGLPCGGLCQGGAVCWADDLTCAPPTTDCPAACFGDAACRFGVCAPIIRAPRPPHHDAVGTGVDPHVIAQNQSIWVVFYRAHLGQLALLDGPAGGGLTLTVLDAGTTRAGFGPADVGRNPRAALGADGALHVAYHDDLQRSLRYLAWDTTARALIRSEELDPGAAASPPRLIGGMDLALRGAAPVVAYQDATAGALMGARRLPDDTWLTQTLAVQGVSGLSPALLIDGARAFILSGVLTPDGGGFAEAARLILWP